jgi:hypothetical protein
MRIQLARRIRFANAIYDPAMRVPEWLLFQYGDFYLVDTATTIRTLGIVNLSLSPPVQ